MTTTFNYGAAPTYVKIATQNLNGLTTTTFNNIPQGYTDLFLIVDIGSTSGASNCFVRFNGDSASSYSETYIGAESSLFVSRGTSSGVSPIYSGSNLSGTRAIMKYQIMNYSNSSFYKNTIGASHVGGVSVTNTFNTWRNTAPITSLTVLTTGVAYNTGSSATLYGIEAALTPKATGGDIVVQDGQYWYHAFRTTGVFVPRQALTADILTVAGGGAGGSVTGGGGGAGGYVYSSSQSLTAEVSRVVTVGAGGTSSYLDYAGSDTNGSNSQFASLTAAVGGGKGGRYNGTAGNEHAPSAGGSGGGAGGKASTNITGGAGTAGQGFAGGNSIYGGTAAGGGGAGGAGADGTSNSTAAAGGIGINTYASIINVVNIGVNGYFGGGGAGTSDTGGGTGGVFAVGGAGGGGSGGNSMPAGTTYNGGNGVAHTGSGGGGGAGGNAWGGRGGSGFVIVRYSI